MADGTFRYTPAGSTQPRIQLDASRLEFRDRTACYRWSDSAEPAPLCAVMSAHFPAGTGAGMPSGPLFLTLPTARPDGANPADAALARPRILRITR